MNLQQGIKWFPQHINIRIVLNLSVYQIFIWEYDCKHWIEIHNLT